jgi:hypothetical protein
MIAKAGEPVTDVKGYIICYVKHDIGRYSVVTADDFHNFTEGNTPWVAHERLDPRCTRQGPNGGLQICINGEWRP